MNRRGFLAGVAAALGLAKAGVLGAEEVEPFKYVARVSSTPEPYSVHFTSWVDVRAVHRDDYVFFADGR